MGNAIENTRSVVKNTTKLGLLDLLCPHTCRGCGRLGSVLCERCKKYINLQKTVICPLCKSEFALSEEMQHGVCADCRNDTVFQGLYAVSWREGALAKVVKDYKYKSVRAASEVLAELIDARLPRDMARVVVVPLPTIGRHVRERGIDHTLLLAKKLARRRRWKVERILARATDTVQVGTSEAKRREQAARMYVAVRKVDPEAEYLLLDDVWTTGASMLAAGRVLREKGARKIRGAIVEVGRDKNLADKAIK